MCYSPKINLQIKWNFSEYPNKFLIRYMILKLYVKKYILKKNMKKWYEKICLNNYQNISFPQQSALRARPGQLHCWDLSIWHRVWHGLCHHHHPSWDPNLPLSSLSYLLANKASLAGLTHLLYLLHSYLLLLQTTVPRAHQHVKPQHMPAHTAPPLL